MALVNDITELGKIHQSLQLVEASLKSELVELDPGKTGNLQVAVEHVRQAIGAIRRHRLPN